MTSLLRILWVLPLFSVGIGKNFQWIICFRHFSQCTQPLCLLKVQDGTNGKTKVLSSIKPSASINCKLERWDKLAKACDNESLSFKGKLLNYKSVIFLCNIVEAETNSIFFILPKAKPSPRVTRRSLFWQISERTVCTLRSI